MLIIQIIGFVVCLMVLAKGAEIFLKVAEKIGLAVGFSPFIIGVTVIGIGTSFPELFTATAASFKNVTEIIPANVIGANIANILLIVGVSAIFGKKLVVSKDLIDIDLPLLAITTSILVLIIFPWGADFVVITRAEAMILIIAYIFYLLYTIFYIDDTKTESNPFKKEKIKKSKIYLKDWGLLILGIFLLSLGAKYLVDFIVLISDELFIGAGIISIVAVAIGTTIPELTISVKAAIAGKSEIALGNVFGSNIFNSFVVIGLPGLFRNIYIDESTYLIGLPMMIIATFLFIISGISKRIHSWEGIFFLLLYIIFIGKILNIL